MRPAEAERSSYQDSLSVTIAAHSPWAGRFTHHTLPLSDVSLLEDFCQVIWDCHCGAEVYLFPLPLSTAPA